jgi:hypothetical protein
VRTPRSFAGSLVPSLVLLAAACENGDSPLEPSLPPEAAPAVAEPAAIETGRWADGYVLADSPALASYTPPSASSYNRGGGAIRIQRVSGTTGRYILTFTGLSAVLGTRSTVQVTAHDAVFPTRCKPVNGHLVSDKVEVRCYLHDGTPVNTRFGLVVLGKSSARAFAFGHLPAEPSYAPKGAGSWNPAGSTRVVRHGIGFYEVTFNNLGSRLTSSHGGHVQVGAAGMGKAYCKIVDEWAGSPNLKVRVQCYAATGAPADAKFTVLFHLPAPHLAYGYSSQTGSSSGDPFWTWNPTIKSGMTFNRYDAGQYNVNWANVDPEIIGTGTAHVTAVGIYDNGSCMIGTISPTGAQISCFAANGVLADVPFTVLLGS